MRTTLFCLSVMSYLTLVTGLGVPGEYYPKVQWSDPGTDGQTAADLDERLGYNLTHLAPWRKILRHDQITNLHRPYGLHPLERANPIWKLKATQDGGYQQGADGEMSWTDGRDPTPFPGRCIDLEDRGLTTYYRHTLPNGEWLPTQTHTSVRTLQHKFVMNMCIGFLVLMVILYGIWDMMLMVMKSHLLAT